MQIYEKLNEIRTKISGSGCMKPRCTYKIAYLLIIQLSFHVFVNTLPSKQVINQGRNLLLKVTLKKYSRYLNLLDFSSKFYISSLLFLFSVFLMNQGIISSHPDYCNCFSVGLSVCLKSKIIQSILQSKYLITNLKCKSDNIFSSLKPYFSFVLP